MKTIVGLIIFNVLLLLFVFYKINMTSDVKVSYLKNVNNLNLDEGVEKLHDFEISVIYIESDLAKDLIVYTNPKANSLVYDNQMITLYVSKEDKQLSFENK